MPTVAVRNAASGIFAPVLARLRAESAERFGAAEARLVPIAFEERPFSHLLRVAVFTNGSREPQSHIFVKISKTKPHDGGVEKMRGRVMHDYEKTCHIYAAMSQWNDLGAVRPVVCYPDYLAIVTEETEGRTLIAYLETHAGWFPRPGGLRALEDTLAAVGRWLRAFQSIDQQNDRVSIADLREYVDIRLRRMVRPPEAAIPESCRAQILAHIECLGAHVAPSDLSNVIVHADLALGNILVCGRRIVVLDFSMTTRGSVLHDITRLFVQLDLLRAKPQYRAGVIAALQRSLLRGFDPALAPDHPLFRLLVLLHRVNHLGTLAQRRDPFLTAVYNRRLQARHRAWIATELQRGADARVR